MKKKDSPASPPASPTTSKRMDSAQISACIAITIFAIFAWEVYVAQSETKFRFSYGLELARDYAVRFCKWIGRAIAWISSYLWYIEWQNIVIALKRLLVPVFEILTSWVWIGWGYIQYAKDWAIEIPIMYLGSVLLLLAAFLIGLYYWPERYTSVPPFMHENPIVGTLIPLLLLPVGLLILLLQSDT